MASKAQGNSIEFIAKEPAGAQKDKHSSANIEQSQEVGTIKAAICTVDLYVSTRREWPSGRKFVVAG